MFNFGILKAMLVYNYSSAEFVCLLLADPPVHSCVLKTCVQIIFLQKFMKKTYVLGKLGMLSFF
jgi:hypothetical protein